MNIDLTAAKNFLRLFREELVFLIVPESEKLKQGKARVDHFRGTFEQHKNKLERKNAVGYAIFFLVNETKPQVSTHGTVDVDVISSKYIVQDVDGIEGHTPAEIVEQLDKHLPRPAIIVNTSPGKSQRYWRVEGLTPDDYTAVVKELALYFGTDPKISNKARALRVPGFLHQKNDPHLVTYSIDNHNAVTLQELRDPLKSLTPIASMREVAKAAASATRSLLIEVPASVSEFEFDLNPGYEEPKKIAEGSRYTTMQSIIGQQSAKYGFDVDELTDVAWQKNLEKCVPPYTEAEFEAEHLSWIKKCVARDAAQALAEKPKGLKDPMASVPPPPPVLATKDGQLVAPPPPTSEPQPWHNSDDDNTIENWRRRFVFVRRRSLIADRSASGEYAVYTKQEFENAFKNVRYRKKNVELSKKWLSDKERQDVSDVTYLPNGPKIVELNSIHFFNVYMPSEIRPAVTYDESRTDIFLKFLHFTFPDPKDFKLFVNWMAVTVCHPEARVPWAPLLISNQGAGKGFIYQVIRDLVGAHNSTHITPIALNSEFNDYLKDNVLLAIDEIHSKLPHGAQEELKSAMTEPVKSINTKGIPAKMYPIFCNMLLMTNDPNAAVLIDKDDRRFWVYHWTQVPDAETFRELFAWLKDKENLAHLMSWIMRWDIEGFDFAERPPMSQAKYEMIEYNESEASLALKDAIINQEGPFQADICSFDLAIAYLNEQKGFDIEKADRNKLRGVWIAQTKALRGQGLDRASNNLVESDKNRRFRMLRNVDHWYKQKREAINAEYTRAFALLRMPNDPAAKPRIHSVPEK